MKIVAQLRPPALVLLLLALATVVAAGRVPLRAGDGKRQQPTVDRAAETDGEPHEDHSEGNTVRLRYFNATWPDVLKKVAADTNSILVMKVAPRGRITRVDRSYYSPTEAVRILNAELEPMGYRLLEQNQFLVLLKLMDFRSHYERPELPRSSASKSEPAKRETATPGEPGKTLERMQVQPVAVSQAEEQNRDNDQSGRVVQTAAETLAAETSTTQPSDGGEPAVEVIDLRHRAAKDAARAIYDAYESQAELIYDGPRGLPAFRVHIGNSSNSTSHQGDSVPAENSASSTFTVGIDTQNQQLIVESPARMSRELRSLVEAIDTSPREAKARILTNISRTDEIANALRPNLGRLKSKPVVAMSGAAQPTFGNAFAQVENNGVEANASAQPTDAAASPNAAEQQPQGVSPLTIGGLKGDVDVEVLPESGVLILRGDELDVEQVERLIREIERLSELATPKVRLMMLKHVDSRALAALLGTVYARLTGRPQQQEGQAVVGAGTVSIIPVRKPNAILVIAPPDEIESVEQLVGQLDRPVDPSTTFEVYRLRNAVASRVAALLDEFAGEPEGLSTRVNVIADIRTNSVIVEAAPGDMATVAALIRKIDQDDSGLVNKMRIFPLKNAVAAELANVINIAIQSVLGGPAAATGAAIPGQQQIPGAQVPGQQATGNQSLQQLQEARSVVLEFLSIDAETEQTIRSGILADVRVTADPRTNSLVVTAPQQSMDLMAVLIAQLDQPTSAVAEIKVFTLANGDAAATAELLRSLFAAEGQTDQFGVQVAGAADADSNLIPLRFSVDARTNSILAIGGADALRIVEAILLRLDESDSRERETTVIRLKNSPAEQVALAINAFLESQRELAEVDPELISNVELLEREIIVEAEPVTNNLLVSATPRYYEEVIELIEKLDEAPEQVIIQALLVEVELTNTDEFGVELGFQDSVLFDRSVTAVEDLVTIVQTVSDPSTGIQTTTEQIVSQAAQPGFNFNNQPFGNNISAMPSSVGEQGLTNFSLGRVNGDLGFGGLVLAASSNSVSVLLRALSAQRTVHVLSRPQIRTLDNQPAQIVVGQRVPVIDGVDPIGITGVSPRIVRQDSGIILTVTPRISPDGTIVMQTIAEKSDFTGASVPIFVDATTGNTISSPIQDVIFAQSTVSIPNGQTIVLGGMISKADDTIERKVPYLGDIPFVGKAFRYDSHTETRRELLIFLTPRIIGGPADSELIKQVEAERIHFIEHEAEMIHGPLYAVPPPADVLFDPATCPPEFLDEFGQPPSEMGPVPDELNGLPHDYESPPIEQMPQPEAVPQLPPLPNTEVPPTGANRGGNSRAFQSSRRPTMRERLSRGNAFESGKQ